MGLTTRTASGRIVSLLNEDLAPPAFKSAPQAQDCPKDCPIPPLRPHSWAPITPQATPVVSHTAMFGPSSSEEPISPMLSLGEPVAQFHYPRGGYYYYAPESSSSGPSTASPSLEPITPTESNAPSTPGSCLSSEPKKWKGKGKITYEEEEEEDEEDDPMKAKKRYPCRFRERLNCMEMFTTSGHASRHARIHSGKKDVACTFPGCTKKFTRADNMKQHLQTHYRHRPARTTNNRPTTNKKSAVKRTTPAHEMTLPLRGQPSSSQMVTPPAESFVPMISPPQDTLLSVVRASIIGEVGRLRVAEPRPTGGLDSLAVAAARALQLEEQKDEEEEEEARR
ncbi:transcriptional repressor [Collariella sp. IMI 366227]|nr:transcriptional repressor [Collariella sp. IMI 366227]